MNIEKASRIISDNYNCSENSFVWFLHERSYFSAEKFWEYYESIAAFVGVSEKSPEITRQITESYQGMLKEMIAHFSPLDLSVLDNVPENYTDYIERIDCALLSYYTDNRDLLDNELFCDIFAVKGYMQYLRDNCEINSKWTEDLKWFSKVNYTIPSEYYGELGEFIERLINDEEMKDYRHELTVLRQTLRKWHRGCEV